MKIKHVDELSGGRKRFRRRYSKAVAKVLGESVFQVAMKAREGAALVSEWEALCKEHERAVAKAERKAGVSTAGQLSPLEQWREALRDAAGMLDAIKGSMTEDERREVLADDPHRRGSVPVLV